MKGGITSGVVYPRAVARLARHYRLGNVGGASAGAIAAALAAAAEHGRATGAFDRLDRLPSELGARLPGLFVPSERTRPLHRVLMATLRPRTSPGDPGSRPRPRWGPIAAAAVRAWPRAALAGGLVAGALPYAALALAAAGGGGAPAWVGAALLLPLVAAGVLGGAAVALGRAVLRVLPAEGYGVYSGLAGAAGGEGFTEWISATLDDLAGLPAGAGPLTFGMLCGEEATEAWRRHGGRFPDGVTPRVNLEVTTTDLTHARAQRVPFTEPGRLAFCPVELARVLPRPVLDALENGREPAGTACPDHGRPLLRLPDTPDLPVVLAVRLSLSFPLLIAAVPLWRRAEDGTYRRAWFSDGGIGSNFPVHFFDRLWPRRPTFAIDLQPAVPGGPRFTPPSERPDDDAVWAITGVPLFVRAVFDTMQNWSDRGLAALPGYRDRVTRVHLAPAEGGLNLMMSKAEVEALADAGAAAVEPFLPGAFPGARHRLTRFETATAKLQTTVGQLEVSWRADGWPALVASAPAAEAWAGDAAAYVDALLEGHRRGAAAGPELSAGAPKPEPDLRLTPHW